MDEFIIKRIDKTNVLINTIECFNVSMSFTIQNTILINFRNNKKMVDYFYENFDKEINIYHGKNKYSNYKITEKIIREYKSEFKENQYTLIFKNK